jgi:zinc transport system substrate-binding protein
VNTQTKLAIVAIAVVIPLTSIVVYSTNSNQQYTPIDNSKLQVISSFNPLHEFSQIVGQDKVDVRLLVPVGVEPHDWEPTIKDIQEIQKSNLIIINGIGFENWVDNLAENNYQGIIVDTSEGILINNLDQKNTVDPHIWLNPIYAKKQVQNIALAFSNNDPENGEFYTTNAAEYGKKLDLLDLKIRTELSDCNDDFIAFHDAFSYFAKEYDLNQHTIVPSNNSHGEVTAKTLENVISKARELNIKVIFSEESVNTKTSQIIANEIGGKVLVLSPLEIVSDGDYISKMNQNLEHLKEVLC